MVEQIGQAPETENVAAGTQGGAGAPAASIPPSPAPSDGLQTETPTPGSVPGQAASPPATAEPLPDHIPREQVEAIIQQRERHFQSVADRQVQAAREAAKQEYESRLKKAQGQTPGQPTATSQSAAFNAKQFADLLDSDISGNTDNSLRYLADAMRPRILEPMEQRMAEEQAQVAFEQSYAQAFNGYANQMALTSVEIDRANQAYAEMKQTGFATLKSPVELAIEARFGNTATALSQLAQAQGQPGAAMPPNSNTQPGGQPAQAVAHPGAPGQGVPKFPSPDGAAKERPKIPWVNG